MTGIFLPTFNNLVLCSKTENQYKERKVGGKRYGARSRDRSSLDIWLFEPVKRPDDRADYCLGTRR